MNTNPRATRITVLLMLVEEFAGADVIELFATTTGAGGT